MKSKIVATSGNIVAYTNGETSDNPFHMHPDGAAVFQDPSGSGWVYMSNSEVDSANGGVGAFYFDFEGQVIEYSTLLSGTSKHCGGGQTPWGTWLTGEETNNGQVWEVNSWSRETQKTVIGDNTGNYYESAAFDNRDQTNPAVYVTTDSRNGAIIRYQPDPNLVQEAEVSKDYFRILCTESEESNRVISYT